MLTRISIASACALALFIVLVLLNLGPAAQAVTTDSGLSPTVTTAGGTIVSSDITTHTIWTVAGSPYSVTKYIHVRAGIMLTIAPGVEVQFAQFAGLGAQGQLSAIGSPSQPITLTGSTKQPGSWSGVDVTLGGRVTLQHVVMEYGRESGLPMYGMLKVDGATANVSESVFRYGGSNGISSDLGLTSTVQVSATSFIGNARSAMRFSSFPPTMRDPVLRNLTASGNGLNAIEYYAVPLTGTHVWEDAGLPYAARSGLTVGKGANLSVEPGVEVEADGAIWVYGTLTALGTPAKPITFTGINKAPGAWWGLNVDSIAPLTGTAFFRNVTVEYGGGGGYYPSNLSIGNSAVVSITQSVIRKSSKNGITFAGFGSAVDLSGLSITGNAGYPLYLSGSTDPVLHDITASGNLSEAIGIRPFLSWYSGNYHLPNVGLPYIADGGVSLNYGASLTLEPGVELRMRKDASLYVDGSLYAVGTPALPLTITGDFTGTTPTPGWWRNLNISGNARAIFRYCDIGYGGASSQAMLTIATNRVILQDCRVHHSAAEAIKAVPLGGGRTSKPFVINNRIEQNAFGVRNVDTLYDYVDATYNWWGDASGPYHATNPQGLGNAVSDHVWFEPWLTRPPGTSTELEVQINGPNKFAPGRIEEYAVRYTNNTTQTVQNAVLMVALPSFADYLDDSGGGIVWPQRRQLFWKLGDIPPGRTGLLSYRVRFFWGLPIGIKDSAVAQLGGTNVSMPGFNVQSYLTYVPVTVLAEQALTWSEVQAEQQASPEFNQLYNQALQDGYTRAVAERMMLSAGEPITEVVLLRFEPEFGAAFVRRQGSHTESTLIGETSYRVRTAGGTLSFNFQTDEWEILVDSAASSDQSPQQAAGLTFGECMKNCILEKVPKYLVKNIFKSISIIFKAIDCYKAYQTRDGLDIAKCAQLIKKIPGVSEGIDLGKCNSDCRENPNSHVCTGDIRYCDDGSFPYGTFGIHTIMECKCITDPLTGREGQYMGCTVQQVCAICEKCVETDGGPQCTIPPTGSGMDSGMPVQLSSVSSDSDQTCAECIRAKDPNAKYGPGGDVLPDQLMTYTITFENEGAGTAYDVFVVDELRDELDTSTLVINGGGEYLPASRTLIWWVGQLAPKGQPGSTGVVSFTVRLKSNLANGTAVVNRAVVHFPSVPEVTPTNPVVNIVQPLVASPQSLETVSGQPLVIKLQGRDPGGAPLTYALVAAPLNGALSGTAPNLVYTPSLNFTGIDRLRFTVSNGITTSRPADVDILVHPSPSDNTAPQVVRTEPGNGAVIAQIVSAPHFTDTVGPLYLPAVEIDFSETISDTSVTTDTIRVMDSRGRSVPIRVGYDGAVNKAIVLFREPLKAGTTYSFTVTTGIRDLKGNALPANYTWSVRTAGTASSQIFLPLIMRSAH